MTVYDLVAMGRVGVDLYPLQHGVTLDEVRTFEKFLGGTAANVTVAAARHGLRTALISVTADDAFGRFVHRELLQQPIIVVPRDGAAGTIGTAAVAAAKPDG